jgi:galactokinase/mevalonate kinase-like predicted kinase
LRSIDLGAMEVVETYEQLAAYNKVGSPFSIPKASLVLAGFQPGFSQQTYASLRAQLKAFGSGIELTLLSAIPAGSGLGTSSILAATVIGALADFCGLGWDKFEIGNRSLILEQLLTTGGGWQDQYGGILPGIKLLQTERGFNQRPVVRWLPDTFFRQPDEQVCHLLYYTGLTRTAKHILAEIVQGMFLNSSEHLDILSQMKQHALDLFDAIQQGNFQQYGWAIRKTWEQNKALDAGTEPPAIARLCQQIDDLCLGYKLPGAGGGGYLYMVAKDAEAAGRIRNLLTQQPLTESSRFVNMTLSDKGLQVSRS